MTAPDSPAVAAVRRLAAGYRRLAEVDGDPIGAAADADALDGVLAELAEARRAPRVWLEGDEVPAGVVVIPASGYAFRTGPDPYPFQFEPLVEAVDYAAAVAAERERRTIVAEGPAQPLSATESSGTGSCGSVAWGPVFALPQPGRSGSPEIDFKPRGHRPSTTEPPEAPQTADGDLEPIPAPAERLRRAADEIQGDPRWSVALRSVEAAAALVAWLRSAAEEAEEVGADPRALAFVAAIFGEVPR